MFVLIITILSVLIASFILVLAEAAILSLPLLRAKILVDQQRPNARDVLFLKENIAESLACLVILNNSINIIGSIYIGQLFEQVFGHGGLALASGVLTVSIIYFGEVIPKAFGERFQIPVSLVMAKPMRLLVWLLKPPVKLMMLTIKPFTHRIRMPKVTEEEIKMMIKIGRDAGTVELDEETLINRVFRLNDLRAKDMMKPVQEMYLLPADKTLAQLKDQIILSPYNRIVVYGESTATIVGVVQHRILLREMAKDNHDSTISEWMLKPIFVNHMTKADILIEKFQDFHQHLFIVQDNEGRTVGLVTMEDVFEELFGEIYDEKDIRFRFMKRRNLSNPPQK